jgi:hypothetical protein
MTALLSGLWGCDADATKGYSWVSPYREGIRSVAVDILTRGQNVYRREIEIRATEAVMKRIESEIPGYKVTRKARADTLLSGTINLISQRVLSSNPDTGRPREQEITVVAAFRWTDLRTGEIIKERSNLRVSGTYIQHAPLSEDFSQGREDVLNRLARRIVEEMEADL